MITTKKLPWNLLVSKFQLRYTGLTMKAMFPLIEGKYNSNIDELVFRSELTHTKSLMGNDLNWAMEIDFNLSLVSNSTLHKYLFVFFHKCDNDYYNISNTQQMVVIDSGWRLNPIFSFSHKRNVDYHVSSFILSKNTLPSAFLMCPVLSTACAKDIVSVKRPLVFDLTDMDLEWIDSLEDFLDYFGFSDATAIPSAYSPKGSTIERPILGVKFKKANNPSLVTLSRLPEGYKEVQYLESTGTLYLMTNLAQTTEKHKFEITFSLSDYYDTSRLTHFLFGHDKSSSGYGYGLGMIPKSVQDLDHFYPRHRLNTSYNTIFLNAGVSLINPETNKSLVVFNESQSISKNKKITIINNGTLFTINGRYMGDVKSSELKADTTSGNMAIFAMNTNGTICRHIAAKIYYFKFLNNNLTVLECIPCYRISDGKPGMYDLVNNEFLTNQGDGEFIIGPEPKKLEKITPIIQAVYNENEPKDVFKESEFLEFDSGDLLLNGNINICV